MEKLQSGFEAMFNDFIPILQTLGSIALVAIAIWQFIKSRSDSVVESQTGKKHVMNGVVTLVMAALVWVIPAVAESITAYFK